MVKNNYILLEPINFTPIDIDNVKKDWEEINKIPNNLWDDIEKKLININNESYPISLRTFMLNNLPYCVVKIIMFQLNYD